KVGQLLMAGFEGTTVTNNIRNLIEEYHISTIILSSKNFVNAQQVKKLICDLQKIAKDSGHKYPLMFAIDQEGGMISSLFDENYITQFPGAMGLAATGSATLVHDVCKAMALELKSLGFSINLGPVLDTVTKFSHQLIGVRSFGSTNEEVIKYGKAAAQGFRDGGLFTFGKHFPGLNNAEVSSVLELPILTETLEQVEKSNVVTFKALIDCGLMDGISAAGAAVPNISPNEVHSCLSPILITDLLRNKLKFDGVIHSECLEMEALFCNIGFRQGVIMAVFAGCDLVLVCHDYNLQKEAIHALSQAVEDGILDEKQVIDESIRRIEVLQKRLPSFDDFFNLEDLDDKIKAEHQELSQLAYQKSITLVRDYNNCLPITKFVNDDLPAEENLILLLTPVLQPLYSKNSCNPKNNKPNNKIFPGEEVFQEFGKMLANCSANTKNERGKNFKVLHTSYTANGLTNLHEQLIEKAKVVLLITSETSRNIHQIGITKHISILCGGSNHKLPSKKPLIIIAVSSPYDFFYNNNIGSAYLCTYDYTDNGLDNLAKVLFGKYRPTGVIPGEANSSNKRKIEAEAQSFKKSKNDFSQRRWLVDEFNLKRDWKNLINLASNHIDFSDKEEEEFSQLNSVNLQKFSNKIYHLLNDNADTQKHFVVRNSSLNVLYGFILTWYNGHLKTGSILYILVDKAKRNQSIGESLHSKAIKYLINEKHCERITLGCAFPLIGFPNLSNIWSMSSANKFEEHSSKSLNYILKINGLNSWSVSEKLVRQLQVVGIMFDLCSNFDEALKLIVKHYSKNPMLYPLYKEVINDIKNPNKKDDAKIIVALEPSNRSVVGSIVVFTNCSSVSKFFPFIEEVGVNENNESVDSNNVASKVGGLVGLIIDPSYENLTDVFKLGLVCTALSFLKRAQEDSNGFDNDGGINDVLLIGINKSKNNINNFRDNGFEIYKKYYDCYDER
ncbi:hypothetical protein PACTADRAFT_21208, partial [Pachysolen tannophilus NRRL Y-2460]